jgi:exopolyphosphatase/guanosine-5'-triphosphate,3'-diphosphate pyrophosphatase
MRVAILDVGSNSILLLVADVGRETWSQVAAGERITRLADGLIHTGRFHPAAASRTLTALHLFAIRARALGAETFSVVGTRPFRMAADAAALAARVEAAVGAPLEILSGEREAELGFAGAVTGLGRTRGPVLSIDIGGGSTEIVCGADGAIVERTSLPIGAVVLTQRHLAHDPPAAAEIEALRVAVAEALDDAAPLRRWREMGGGSFIGSGGTVTTLGAMAARLECYRPERVHGSRLTREALDALCAELVTRTVVERCTLPGLDPDRAPVILGGAVVAAAAVAAAGCESMVVSDQGLRHGVLAMRLKDLPAARGGPR